MPGNATEALGFIEISEMPGPLEQDKARVRDRLVSDRLLEILIETYDGSVELKCPPDVEAQKREMTLEHLLTMSGGFFCDDTTENAPRTGSCWWRPRGCTTSATPRPCTTRACTRSTAPATWRGGGCRRRQRTHSSPSVAPPQAGRSPRASFPHPARPAPRDRPSPAPRQAGGVRLRGGGSSG